MIATRTYVDYEQYIHKQGNKARTRRDFILAHLPKNTESFRRVFLRAKSELTPGSVLCLGARSGAESLGAEAAGFPGSAGIDLHPVGPSVVQGDWHQIPFPDSRFNNVYVNCLDHCLYLDRLCREVHRVLVPPGRFYVMASNRTGVDIQEWQGNLGAEAMYWETSDELAHAICGYGFTVTRKWRERKWGHYIFKVR